MTEKEAVKLVGQNGRAIIYAPYELRSAVTAAVKMRRGGGGVREILFRGKRKDNGKWAYGMLTMLYIDADIAKITLVDGIFPSPVSVAPETVGQYVGLEDKSGRKIFEGDVVEDKFNNIGVITYLEQFFDWRIVFFKGREDLVAKNGARILDWTWPKIALKVIGNIHDDPELLKGGGNGAD